MRFYAGRRQCEICLCLMSEYGKGGKYRCFNDRCHFYLEWRFGLKM